MNDSVFYQGVEAVGTLIAAACALYVTFRDGKRIKSGEARALADRVELAERWHESEQGKFLFSKVGDLADKVERHETQMKHLATREDVARLEGQIATGNALTVNVERGVERIEAMLMEHALAGRSL